MFRIRRYDIAPPGSYFYKMLFRNGAEEVWFGPCNGVKDCHRFGPSPTIDDPAKRLSAFRKANNLPRAGITEATEDVDTYTCTRLGNAIQWCHDTAAKPYLQVNPMAQPPRPCGGCGHKLNP